MPKTSFLSICKPFSFNAAQKFKIRNSSGLKIKALFLYVINLYLVAKFVNFQIESPHEKMKYIGKMWV